MTRYAAVGWLCVDTSCVALLGPSGQQEDSILGLDDAVPRALYQLHVKREMSKGMLLVGFRS